MRCLAGGGRHCRKWLQCIDPGPKPFDLAQPETATTALQSQALKQAWLRAVAREAAFDKFQLHGPAHFPVVRTRNRNIAGPSACSFFRCTLP